MELKSLIQRIKQQQEKKSPFVLYSLPNSDVVTCYLQLNSQLYTANCFDRQGMLMAPFSQEGITYCIPALNSEKIEFQYQFHEVIPKQFSFPETDLDRERHLELIANAKSMILDKQARKIVVSRKKEVQLKTIDFEVLIDKLLNLYPQTFRYLWYHPSTGIWCGVSPELLVKTDGIEFSTMSLAGTKKYNGSMPPKWTVKEKNEQQFVTDAIVTSLQKVASALRISKTVTHRAGSVTHLRTDITGILKKGKATLASISASLHPTPAVCGTPQKNAQNFIKEHEGYDREFYTGYIGAIDDGAPSELYVNLRCVKIMDDRGYLYVGGGITEDSNAEDEWEETKNKLQSMLQVLHPFLK